MCSALEPHLTPPVADRNGTLDVVPRQPEQAVATSRRFRLQDIHPVFYRFSLTHSMTFFIVKANRGVALLGTSRLHGKASHRNPTRTEICACYLANTLFVKWNENTYCPFSTSTAWKQPTGM